MTVPKENILNIEIDWFLWTVSFHSTKFKNQNKNNKICEVYLVLSLLVKVFSCRLSIQQICLLFFLLLRKVRNTCWKKINVLNISFKFQNAGAEKTIGVFWFHFSGFGKKASQWIGSSHGEKQGFGWVGKLWKPVSIGIWI